MLTTAKHMNAYLKSTHTPPKHLTTSNNPSSSLKHFAKHLALIMGLKYQSSRKACNASAVVVSENRGVVSGMSFYGEDAVYHFSVHGCCVGDVGRVSGECGLIICVDEGDAGVGVDGVCMGMGMDDAGVCMDEGMDEGVDEGSKGIEGSRRSSRGSKAIKSSKGIKGSKGAKGSKAKDSKAIKSGKTNTTDTPSAPLTPYARAAEAIKAFFPTLKDPKKVQRIAVLKKNNDSLSFRHFYTKGVLKEEEFRFEMRLYEIEGSDRWVYKPYMNTARKK